MKRSRMLVMMLAMAAAGCEAESMEGPPEVRFGQAECVHCGMIVSDPRTAAALLAEVDGQRRELAFDDIGDMIAYEAQRAGLDVRRRYVGDFGGSGWLLVEDATLIKSERLHTPMGSGIIAFADRAAAERKRAEVGGELMSYPQADPRLSAETKE